MKICKDIMHLGRFTVPYRAYGDSNNLLVCVSGALQTMAIWRAFVQRFADDFTVLTFDMPGIGRSTIRHGGYHVSVVEQTRVLDALIDRVDPGGDVTIAASSWGTAIASVYAADHAARVQHLLLGSFAIQPNEGMRNLIERATTLYKQRNFAAGADLILEVFGSKVSAAYKKQIIMQFKKLKGEHAETFYHHCANILKLGRLDEEIDLRRISARTLIINGSEDPLIDPADIDYAAQLIPDCETRVIAGAGHFLHFEKPELLDDYETFLLPEPEESLELLAGPLLRPAF